MPVDTRNKRSAGQASPTSVCRRLTWIKLWWTLLRAWCNTRDLLHRVLLVDTSSDARRSIVGDSCFPLSSPSSLFEGRKARMKFRWMNGYECKAYSLKRATSSYLWKGMRNRFLFIRTNIYGKIIIYLKVEICSIRLLEILPFSKLINFF